MIPLFSLATQCVYREDRALDSVGKTKSRCSERPGSNSGTCAYSIVA